ncbi:unnamed protein product [Miscanthus lutarioriparius]|uniref:Cullin N-terminal domain-containing protein n=1 Tax=Miscanthus lutarioriparius TaxID=422564 RepID=A0A811PC03_9POAL|nr:unnamed protein product [Miscanthus lutarioriparius]
MAHNRKTILLDEGWPHMMAGFEKLKLILAGEPGVAFASDEYMHLYTSTIYNMCTQKPANDYSAQLYERYKELLDGYITATDKHGEFLLKELVFRWKNHKLMVRWLSRFLTTIKATVTSILIAMVDEDREGQIIDRTLVKNVLG